MRTVNVHEAKTQFSRLIDAAHAGETILVDKEGWQPLGTAGAAGNRSATAAARAAAGSAAASPHRIAQASALASSAKH
jgi:antitoxin (DNA-binding transcriptional repressor) of toxin-antitoxin stability system